VYRVTYIQMTPDGPKLLSISHPSRTAAMVVYDALLLAGVHVRLWDAQNRLVNPARV
jgi:hypothetical protein